MEFTNVHYLTSYHFFLYDVNFKLHNDHKSRIPSRDMIEQINKLTCQPSEGKPTFPWISV